MLAAAFVLLLALALFATFHRPPAELRANVVTTALKFVYHAIEEGRTGGNDVALLAGEPLTALSVRSFETLTAPSGVLSVWDEAGKTWQVVQRKGPIVITSDKDSPAKANFDGVMIKSWHFDGKPDVEKPTVTLGIPVGQALPSLHAVIEGKNIDLFFDAGESVEFECQLCRIEGLDESAARLRQVRLSDLEQVDIKASSGSTMILDVTPGPKGFGNQRFRMSQPWFCGGRGAEPESKMVSSTVEFTETSRKHSFAGQASANRPSSVLRLIPDDEFVVTALGVVDKDGPALDLHFHGLARSAELSAACDASGTPFQPSVAETLALNPVVSIPYGALMLLTVWLAAYDKVKGLWTRMRPEEAAKK